jgi:hypothetical protein
MDRREEILVRLLAIVQTIFKTAARNKNDFSDLARPAGVVLDGDEKANEQDPENRPPDAPRRVTMAAEIVALASEPAETIGTTINGYRVALLKGIVTDATLIGLVLDGERRQSIRYIGSSLIIQSDRAIAGELRLQFEFTYALRFEEL